MTPDKQTTDVVPLTKAKEHDCVQVVLAFPSVISAFEEWLGARGLYLFPIPVGSADLPTYGIGFHAEGDDRG